MKRIGIILFLLLAVAIGCKSKSDSAAVGSAPVGVINTDGRWFKDSQGRVVILRGINMAGSVKNAPYVYDLNEADYDNLKKWGFNVVRLLIIWDAIEHEKGVFDMSFFLKVDEQIQWAAERGIYVILDMHQDLYGPAFNGDGAPAWASRQDIPFTWNDPWGINYFAPAVVASWDDFWVNPELQEHFTQAWLVAVNRYLGQWNVIGYDLFNEPNFGSRPPWNFERDYLGPFQDRVAARIRAVDPTRIIFYETIGFGAGGLPTFIPPPAVKGNVALAPHFYDPALGWVHTDPYDLDNTRMAKYMDLRERECIGLGNIPWLMGEYGVANGVNSDIYVKDIYDQLDAHMASGTWWAYGRGYMAPLNFDGTERSRVKDMARPYPSAVAGEPISFAFDQPSNTFILKWKEVTGVTGPTEIQVQKYLHYPNGFDVSMTDANWTYEFDGNTLKVYPDHTQSLHTLTVRPVP